MYRKIDDMIAKWEFDKALALLQENKKKFPEDDFLDDKKIKVQQAKANYMEEQKKIEELEQRAKVEVTLGNYSKALDLYEQVYSKRESPELKETILKMTLRALRSSIAREKFEETSGNVKRLSKYGKSYPNWLDDFIKGAVEKTNREVEGFYQKLKDHLGRMGVDDLEKEVEALREKYQAASYRSPDRNRLYRELNKKQKELYKKKNKIYPVPRQYYNTFNDYINFKMKTVDNWKRSFHYKDPRRKKLDQFKDYLSQVRTKYSRLMYNR